MTIRELLSKERDDYVSVWMGSLLEHREKYPPAVAEVLLEMNSSANPLPYRFYRPDITCGGAENPKLVDVNKDKHYTFESLELTAAEEIPGRLFPFRWYGIEFRLFGDVVSWNEFEKWILFWMDVDDARYDKDKELTSVIHHVTVPERVGDYFEFSVDFGSADVDAFFDLLSLFPNMGVTKFEVGSFSTIDA